MTTDQQIEAEIQAEAETARHIEDTARRAIAPMLAEIERQRAEYLRRHSEINRR